MKERAQRVTSVPVFLAALSTVTKTCKEAECPLMGNGEAKCGM